MRNMLIRCFLTVLFVSVSSAYAGSGPASKPANTKTEKTINTTCQTLKLKSHDKNIVLEASQTSQIYFLKNHTQKSIWLDHPNKHPSASAGWSSYLRPGNSSAILIDKKDFALSCEVILPGKVDYLDCAQSLTVCKPQHLSYTTSRKGSFWLVEDKSADELVKGLMKRGVM